MSGPFWSVTDCPPFKRVHRPTCRHARHPYNWAEGLSGVELVDRLVEESAEMWHLGCRVCCPALDDAIVAAQQDHTRRVIAKHLGLSEGDSTRSDSRHPVDLPAHDEKPYLDWEGDDPSPSARSPE